MSTGLPAFAATVLAPFFEDDVLEPHLAAVTEGAFSFPIPLVPLSLRSGQGKHGETAVLELFHGPTAAFKDVGARILAAGLDRLPADSRTVLVATSGDTGGAVAAAFHAKPRIRVGLLYPDGGVSPRQEKQLTGWGGNVVAIAIAGSFDVCQRLVKSAFADPAWQHELGLTTANSINLGRLLPQTVYYARASLEYKARTGEDPGFVIPTGNVGNAVGALWARRMGFPIREIVLATNANRTVPDYMASGRWEPRAGVKTLANAMDVGDPSNMERIFHLYPDREVLRRELRAVSIDDDTIRRTIREGKDTWGRVWDPHTATATHVRERIGGSHWIIVATAHPAKFETIVEPLIGESVPVPPSLERILENPNHGIRMGPDLAGIRKVLLKAPSS